MKLEFSRQIFEKYSGVKFYENPSSGSRVVPCRQTDGQADRQTDMTKLIVTFHNFCERAYKSRVSWGENDAYNFQLSSRQLGVRKRIGVHSTFYSTYSYILTLMDSNCSSGCRCRFNYQHNLCEFWCRVWFQSVRIIENCFFC